MAKRDVQAELPEVVQRELCGLFEPGRFPEGRDAAILAAARRAQALKRSRRWRLPAGVGVAAMLALAGTLFWMSRGHRAGVYVRTGDIRDAFYVAREIKTHGGSIKMGGGKPALDARWDVNHDGVIDEKDVQELAASAVRMTPAQEGAGR